MWLQLGARIMEISTYFSYSRQVNVATWFLVLPIDIENPYDYWEGDYIYIIYIIYIYEYVKFLASHFSDLARCKKFTGWAIIEELSIRWRLRTFLISWGQKMRVKHCYVDLSSRYEFWSAMICITNIISDLSTTIRDGFDSLPVKWVNTGFFFFFLNTTTGNNSVTDVSLLRQNVKIKCKEYFSYHFPCWPVGVFLSNHVVFKFPLTMHTAGNRGGKHPR